MSGVPDPSGVKRALENQMLLADHSTAGGMFDGESWKGVCECGWECWNEPTELSATKTYAVHLRNVAHDATARLRVVLKERDEGLARELRYLEALARHPESLADVLIGKERPPQQVFEAFARLHDVALDKLGSPIRSEDRDSRLLRAEEALLDACTALGAFGIDAHAAIERAADYRDGRLKPR